MAKSSIRPPDDVIENPDKPTNVLKSSLSTDAEYSVESRIRPPDEVIENPDKPTNFLKSDESESYSTVDLSKKWLIIALIIAIILEITSWIIPTGGNYMLFWFPLIVGINCMNFAAYFVYKCHVDDLSIYLKVAGIGYFALNLVSTFGILIPNTTAKSVITVAYMAILACMSVSILIYGIKCLQKNV